MEKELIIYQKSLSAIFPHPSEAGKVCRKCFDDLGKYFRLKEELLQNFRESMLLLKKWVSYLNLVRYSSASYRKYVTYLTFFLIAVSLQTTPKRKRRRVGEGSEEHNIARRIISDESSFTLEAATSSPPVTV